jgi:hypothetical protein
MAFRDKRIAIRSTAANEGLGYYPAGPRSLSTCGLFTGCQCEAARPLTLVFLGTAEGESTEANLR